jgi:hypothetical protein
VPWPVRIRTLSGVRDVPSASLRFSMTATKLTSPSLVTLNTPIAWLLPMVRLTYTRSRWIVSSSQPPKRPHSRSVKGALRWSC